jgi:Domain of unknown function (DUF1993)
MSLSMYQASVPAFLQTLNNLSAILDKAEAYAGNRKIDPEVLLADRRIPDQSAGLIGAVVGAVLILLDRVTWVAKGKEMAPIGGNMDTPVPIARST